ncbi:restin homolog [Danio aesculapii]|uniref:restin homolog n=1 Tax=Danio aesculapii TaxID=1142201 RepID=UPI0024C04AD7|nr:restin homolog [Danio aesculapii]
MATTSNKEFHLIVPKAQSVEVNLGSSVSVQCLLSPEISAVDLEIRWFKETECVCLYKNREVTEGRSYEGRTGLSTDELKRGNVSLNLRDFRESDMGVYLCQVISEDRTEEKTVEVGRAKKDSDAQPVNQTSKIQDTQVHLTLQESNTTYGETQRMKMEESALITELQVNYAKLLHQTMFKVFKNQGEKLEQTGLQLKTSKKDLERVSQQLETITEKFGLQNKNDLDMKESRIEKHLQQITKFVEEKQIQLKEKDTQLENMSKQMSEKEKLLEDTMKEMKTSKQQLEALTQEQSNLKEKLEKNEHLRISELSEKSKCLEETKSLLEERDAKIKDLEKEKERLDGELQDKDKRLNEINAKLIQTVRDVEKKQNQLQGRHVQLENMHKMLNEKTRHPENKGREQGK